MILDTDFLISLRAGDDAAVELASDLDAAGVPTRVPAIVIHELSVAVGAGATPKANARDFDARVTTMPIVTIDGAIARRAGRLEGGALA